VERARVSTPPGRVPSVLSLPRALSNRINDKVLRARGGNSDEAAPATVALKPAAIRRLGEKYGLIPMLTCLLAEPRGKVQRVLPRPRHRIPYELLRGNTIQRLPCSQVEVPIAPGVITIK
jgi:hypothetical protein